MIEKFPRVHDRWRQWWPAVLVLVLFVVAGLLVGGHLRSGGVQPVAAPSSMAPTKVPLLESTPSPTATPSRTPDLFRLLQLPGKVPTHGSGSFRYGTSTGPVMGRKGPLRRFRVGVENGSGEDVAAFAAQVQATLGDPRSWTGGGTLRLRMVAAGEPYDFTVYLATRDTAGKMCLAGGTNVTIHGRPYTSCRTTGKAIINLDRWRLSSNPYLAAKVPLGIYRQYVINHEVGHELGQHHVGCPKAGGPAPVMVQQTLTLRGCVLNAWPRYNDKFLTGPPV
ncbi:MAG TPA: DUF3152 domain-containing protein [Actinoplanes sp.]